MKEFPGDIFAFCLKSIVTIVLGSSLIRLRNLCFRINIWLDWWRITVKLQNRVKYKEIHRLLGVQLGQKIYEKAPVLNQLWIIHQWKSSIRLILNGKVVFPSKCQNYKLRYRCMIFTVHRLALSFTLLKMINSSFCQSASFLLINWLIFLRNRNEIRLVILFGRLDKQKDNWKLGIMENNQEKLHLRWHSVFKIT